MRYPTYLRFSSGIFYSCVAPRTRTNDNLIVKVFSYLNVYEAEKNSKTPARQTDISHSVRLPQYCIKDFEGYEVVIGVRPWTDSSAQQICEYTQY